MHHNHDSGNSSERLDPFECAGLLEIVTCGIGVQHGCTTRRAQSYNTTAFVSPLNLSVHPKLTELPSKLACFIRGTRASFGADGRTGPWLGPGRPHNESELSSVWSFAAPECCPLPGATIAETGNALSR